MFKFLQPFLNKELWDWIANNRSTFIIVILLLGNVYQYYDGSQRFIRHEENVRELNAKLGETNKAALNYERERSATLENLLNNLVIKYNTLDSTNKALQQIHKP